MSKTNSQSPLPIYVFPGIIREYQIFQPLVLALPNATLLKWIDPEPGETLPKYAERMAEQIPTSNCIIAGISFGGVVAQEVSRLVQPRTCFVISSIRHPRELPIPGRLCRYITGRRTPLLLRAAGHLSSLIPRFIWRSGTLRLGYFTGPHGKWIRWATSEVVNWQPSDEELPTKLIQIHGDTDCTFPIKYLQPDVVIREAGHSLAISHPREVAQVILTGLSETSADSAVTGG